MKDMDIIFPLISHEFVSVKRFGHHSPKVEYFPEKVQNTENCTFYASAENVFFKMLSFEERLRFSHKTNSKWLQIYQIFNERRKTQYVLINF